ncbi:hypothetical protein HK405_004455 [Cladochytrium tenue]|nr:hypothetical protein HK405_004455 [Cladochytrium tenue]
MPTLADPAAWAWRLAPDAAAPAADARDDAAARLVGSEWRPTTQVPSVVSLELAAAGLLPDAFTDDNENSQQWVGDVDWEYRCVFDLTDPELAFAADQHGTLDLVFDGLDTVASVFVNGKLLLESDNMFIPARVSIKDAVKLDPGAENTLLIRFSSATRVAKEREAIYGRRSVWNGDASRVYAQYHWGWDWGPVTVTCGPWRPVRLEGYRARIDDLRVRVDVNEDLDSATISCDTSVAFASAAVAEGAPLQVAVELIDPSGGVITHTETSLVDGAAAATFTIKNPQLWWPAGQGDQPLYTVRAALVGPNGVDTAVAKRIGCRRLRLVEDLVASAAGSPSSTTFFFEINNRPTFCGGSNWIPADSFTPRATRTIYAAWLALTVRGRQNMLRVWGGGIYEHDDFYDLCDELGVLVWQDFMFACGAYPAHDAFRASVAAEAKAALRRLRGRPCLAILTGNNEDYAFAESYDLGYDRNSQDEDQWRASGFPARLIYERTLPEVVREMCPEVPYKPGSPWSAGGRESSDTLIGDIHQWNVWHGAQQPYQNYKSLSGRFVSEFGMQGFPSLKTVQTFFSPEKAAAAMHLTSALMDHHNKADGFLRRIACYVYENLRFSTNLKDFIYASQLVQAESAGFAYRDWRRKWTTELRGVDYYRVPKPAYFVIRRELAPLTLGIERRPSPGATGTGTPAVVDIWASNSTAAAVSATLEVSFFDAASGAELPASRFVSPAPLAARPNSATELATALQLPTGAPAASVIIRARLLDPADNAAVLARAADWPQPLRHLPYPAARPTVRLHAASAAAVRVAADRPVRGLWIVAGDGGEAPVPLEDNFLDVFPDEELEVPVADQDGVAAGDGEAFAREVKGWAWRYLYDWEH